MYPVTYENGADQTYKTINLCALTISNQHWHSSHTTNKKTNPVVQPRCRIASDVNLSPLPSHQLGIPEFQETLGKLILDGGPRSIEVDQIRHNLHLEQELHEDYTPYSKQSLLDGDHP